MVQTRPLEWAKTLPTKSLSSENDEAGEAMNIDPSPANNALSLLNLTSGGPRSSISKLCSSTRAVPTPKDFHFLYKFDEFKLPAQKISKESHSMLGAIASSSHGEITFSRNSPDDGYDYPVTVNGEVFDSSADDFQKTKKSEEESGKRGVESDDGVELVSGKESKGVSHSGSGSGDAAAARSDWSAVKAASKLKPKAHFHDSTIRKPQEEFNILVDNSNTPFNHVWLQKSEDGTRFIHPLEKLSVSDFVDKDIGDVKPMEPLSLECTPFKLVEEVKDLEVLAAKLHSVNEFAVDLEHNKYRSFQGLTCLMQISTRTEDFVVDTLKLWIHVGPYLRDVFKDPTKKKVMHGANRDIIWLQRDFGIYVCNLFDTGQASRVLKLESKSLAYLLHHYCGVTANKQYQTADWRVRPLPDEMIRYGREDTHYLLYIYDLMRIELSSVPEESGNANALLLDVYNHSYALCMHLYEKELLTEDSFLSLYGLQGANLNAQQLAIVAGLYEWRDAVARVEDESTGYILPNKTLLEIATQMPVTSNKLFQLVTSKYRYVEHDLASVVSIIKHSMSNGPAFEAAAELLRQRYMETVSKDKAPVNDKAPEVDPPDMADAVDENTEPSDITGSTSEQVTNKKGSPSEHHTGSVQSHNSSTITSSSFSIKVLKKPDGSLGALKRKLSTHNYKRVYCLCHSHSHLTISSLFMVKCIRS